MTRAELREELATKPDRAEVEELLRRHLATKPDRAEVEELLRKELATKADKADVEELRKLLATKADKADVEDLRTAFNRLMERFDREAQERRAGEQRLLDELARHTRAVQESMQVHVSVVDEKYNDLPGRVGRLEAEVFPPGRRRR